MTSITVCILTKNEEKNLPACLESVRWANEIQVLDSGSTDRTLEIARAAGATVLHRAWTGFYDQRVHQFSLPTHEWFLWLDADERCTEELKNEIQALLEKGPTAAGYNIPRLTYFHDKPVYHCGWFPDRMPRLLKKGAWGFNRPGIHAKVVVNGQEGQLNGLLEHRPDFEFKGYFQKVAAYAQETAKTKYEAGKRCGLLTTMAIGPLRFLKTYLFQGGILDGMTGLEVSFLGAVSDTLKYYALYRLSRAKTAE